MKKLTAAQAREYALADTKVGKLKAALEQAEKRRTELRERYLPRIPLSADVKEAERGVRLVEVGGLRIRVTPVKGSDEPRGLRIGDYLAAGHKITAVMRKFVWWAGDYDRWTVKDLKGPKRVDAVEPVGPARAPSATR